ncbi:MAG: alpha-2-macroglobulin family protein, partial [Polyangiaceae bacterium]
TQLVAQIGNEVQSAGVNPNDYNYTQEVMTRLAQRVHGADFWGNAYTITSDGWQISFTSLGPDEKASATDDVVLSFQAYDLGLMYGWPSAGGDGTGGASGAAGSAGSGGSFDPGTGGSTGGDFGAPRLRKDFPETLFVQPSLITGPDGKAVVQVPMADSITTWRVSTLAHSANGKLGGSVSGIKVFQDFFADMSFPATLTRGDEVTFPVAVYNYLDVPQDVALHLEAGSWMTPLGPTDQVVSLQPGEVKGVQIPIRLENVGVFSVKVTALGSQKSDAVQRMVRVIPDGREIASSQSDSAGSGDRTLAVSYPSNSVNGSPHLHVDFYPAFLSQVVSGMDSILATPNGCFEQTTSTTWPNVLVTRYMTTTGQITPEIQMKAESLISAGYQRLMTFEHPGGGFSWFGTQDPAPFLSVTAFGLMEFADMSQVYSVDQAMVDRTAQWLISKQKSDGSWDGDVSEFFSFNTSTLRNTAFVAWALGSAGYASQAQGAVGYLKAQGTGPQDNYTLGILANAMVAIAPSDPFTSTLLESLDNAKVVDGEKIHWGLGDTQTDFYGSGQDGDVTATALATHALLASHSYPSSSKGGLSFLAASRDPNGNFGSTQATVWALRTLLLAASTGTDEAVGALEVSVDNQPPTLVNFAAGQGDVMQTVDLSSLVSLGDHSVKLSFVGTGKYSYNVVSRYNIPWADVAADPAAPLTIGVSYDHTNLVVNDTVTATVTMTNNTDTTENMVLATLGIPPGFEVLTEDFDGYLSSGVLSKVETTGRQLILYVSKIAPSATLSLSYRLRATMPVSAADGGAVVFPYYQPTATSSASSTTFVVANAQ